MDTTSFGIFLQNFFRSSFWCCFLAGVELSRSCQGSSVLYCSLFPITLPRNLFWLLFKYSCLHFQPTWPPTHPNLPPLNLHPLALSMCPSYMFLDGPPIIPSPLPSGYCQFVLYFSVSGSTLLAHLFCWLGSTEHSHFLSLDGFFLVHTCYTHPMFCLHKGTYRWAGIRRCPAMRSTSHSCFSFR